MRYSAPEKYEVIQLVQNSSLSVRQTLARLDIHKSTFYNWLKRYDENGVEGLEDKKPVPRVVLNKIEEEHCDAIIALALEQPALSPRELAVTYTDKNAYFISESTVYRLLKEQDLITSPAYILMEASDTFQQPTTRVNECGKQILPISRLWVGDGITYLPYWMITHVILLPGVCVQA